MTSDKLRDAVEKVLNIIQEFEDDTISSPIFMKTREIKQILKKAFEPEHEPNLYRGCHVVMTLDNGLVIEGILLNWDANGYTVLPFDSTLMTTCFGDRKSCEIMIHPDWSPPGYLKNPGYDNIEMEVKKEIDYWFENTERNFWELSDLITSKVFSLWPDESEGE